MNDKTHHPWRIELDSLQETDRLANTVADIVGPGDLITLTGDLGAGKTTFARALIRRLVCDPAIEAPSPTFTLMQIYEGPSFPIVHADLYRIASPEELRELGWEEATDSALVLVEWADRAGGFLPAHRLDIAFSAEDFSLERRTVVLTGYGGWALRLKRAEGVQAIMRKAGWADAHRKFMLGDASSRAYERLTRDRFAQERFPHGGEAAGGDDAPTAILMISPPRPDGPPVRYGKSYSAIARLAETITPFVALAQALGARSFSAPKIYASDLERGFAVLEDFGDQGFVDEQGPIFERIREAVAVLAAMHAQEAPSSVPIPGREGEYAIPPYDIEALLIEVELLLEWYAPHVARARVASGHRASFMNLWRAIAQEVAHGGDLAQPVWTLRDYHSPNLIWLPARQGLARVGLLDFQDCVLGHPAYDLVSLLQDARVDVSDEMELRLLGYYAQLRKAGDPSFDLDAFARAYAILGAQRATKILGIFARLDKRDGKSGYLKHIPRVRRYLRKNLSHRALAPLREWHETHTPALLTQD